jgi:hypothetical protein
MNDSPAPLSETELANIELWWEPILGPSRFAQARYDIRRLIATVHALQQREQAALTVLRQIEFLPFFHDQCPVCHGWDAKGSGETPRRHTKDCALAKLLKEVPHGD